MKRALTPHTKCVSREQNKTKLLFFHKWCSFLSRCSPSRIMARFVLFRKHLRRGERTQINYTQLLENTSGKQENSGNVNRKVSTRGGMERGEEVKVKRFFIFQLFFLSFHSFFAFAMLFGWRA